MNIFYLDKNPIIAASYLCDQHASKMVLETAQMLSMVSWRYGIAAPYKNSKTHKNHPCTKWAGDSLCHWSWLLLHGYAIAEQYTNRYNRIHNSTEIIDWCYTNGGRPSVTGFKHPPLCMPEEYMTNDPVLSYRSFYIGDKTFARWKLNNIPEWYNVQNKNSDKKIF